MTYGNFSDFSKVTVNATITMYIPNNSTSSTKDAILTEDIPSKDSFNRVLINGKVAKKTGEIGNAVIDGTSDIPHYTLGGVSISSSQYLVRIYAED